MYTNMNVNIRLLIMQGSRHIRGFTCKQLEHCLNGIH